MASQLVNPNLSSYTFFAIPAYYFITLGAHIYGQMVSLGKVPKKDIDNTNPRVKQAEAFQKHLSPREYARYQRCAAAHSNGHENFSFFVAAALSGIVAGLSKEEMDRFAIATVVGRLLYTVLYINTEKKRYSMFRSLVWTVGVAWNATTLVRAGLRISNAQF